MASYTLCILLPLLSLLYQCSQLSTANCPTSFDVTVANVTSGDQLSFIASTSAFFKGLRGQQNANRMQKIVLDGDTQDLSNYIMSMTYPFIAVAVAFFITYMTIIMCCLFQKSCPPCQSWKRDFVKRPYEKSQLRCVAISFLVFCILTGGLAIAAFVLLPDLKNGADNAKCGLFRTIDVTLNGDTTNNWGGFTVIKNLIGNISSTLATTGTAVTTYFGDNTWMVNWPKDLQNKNNNLYSSYSTSTLFNPDPSTPAVNITPLFIQTTIKPNGTAGSLLTDLDSGFQVTQKLTAQAYKVDQAARLLKDSIPTVTGNIAGAQTNLQMYNSYLGSTQTTISSVSSSFFDDTFTWGIYMMEGIIGFTLAASVMGLIGVIATHFFDIYNCRSMAHVSWAIYGIMYFGVILLTFAFLPGASLASDFCDVFNSTVSNRTYYRNFGARYSQSVLTKLEVCIFDQGQMLSTFNVYSDLKTISSVFELSTTYQSMRNTSNSLYVDLTYSPNKINGWITAMGNYRDGIYVDCKTTITNNSNPSLSVNTLNTYTMGVALSNCSQDTWVYDVANCTAGMNVYTNSSTSANALTLTTVPICISFNSMYDGLSTSPWSLSEFQSRYIQISLTCASTYSQIIAYGTQIIKYRDSRINLYKSIASDLSTMLTVNTNINNKHTTFEADLANFRLSVATLDNLVNDKLSGLNVLSNCRQIGNQMKFTKNALCGQFLATAQKLGICFLILAGLMIGAVITGSVFAIKYAKVERQSQTITPVSQAVSVLNIEWHSERSIDKSSDAD